MGRLKTRLRSRTNEEHLRQQLRIISDAMDIKTFDRRSAARHLLRVIKRRPGPVVNEVTAEMKQKWLAWKPRSKKTTSGLS